MMQRPFHFVLVLAALPLFRIGQGEFSRTWDFGNLETQVIPTDDGYLLISLSPPPLNGIALWKTESSGSLIDTSVYRFSDPVSLRGRALIKVGANNYIQSHSEAYQVDSGATRFIKFNRALDTLKSKMLFPDSTGSYDIWDLANGWNEGEIVGTGFHFSRILNEYRLFWLRMDTSLNVLGYRKLDRRLWGQHIQKSPNREYLVSGLTSLDKAKSEGFMMCLDSAGNKLWERNFTGQYAVGTASPFANDTLGRWVLMPQKMDATGSRSRLRLVALDAQGTVLKDTLLPYDFYHLGYALNYVKKDDSFVATGFTRQSGGFKHFIFNFTENGDSLALRYHHVGDSFDQSYTFSGYLLKDSSLIFGGFYNNTYQPPAGNRFHNWLLKTDKHGCVVSGCQNIGLPENELPYAVKIYPNPASQNLNVEWEDSKTAIISLQNMVGQELLRKEVSGNSAELDVAKLRKGFYLLVLETVQRRMSRKILIE